MASGGMHFCSSEEQVPLWLEYGSKLAFISIPDDAKVIHKNNFSKASKIIINNIINLKDWDMWENQEFYLNALEKNPLSLQYVKAQTEEICFKAVKQNGLALQHIKNQNKALCLEAVKQNGAALQFAKDCAQTDTFCSKNDLYSTYVENQDYALCLEAVRQCGYALQYVKNQNEYICLEAVKQTEGGAFKYVKNQLMLFA